MFDAIDHRRWDSLGDAFSSDVVYERPGYPTIVGIEELTRFYRDLRIVASGHHSLLLILADGSAAACAGRFIGKDKDGAALDERFADIYTFRDGKVTLRVTHFFRAAI